MSQIRNTTADMNDPGARAFFLAAAMAEGSPDGEIVRQEKNGQHQLVNSQMLPTEILHCTQADFEAFGFIFGEADPGDPMFRPVTLPAGWSKRPTEHNMWSVVVDELGRERAEVFYKAAWYDRSAHMWLVTLSGYIAKAIREGDVVVSDESWATRDATASAAVELKQHLDEELAKFRRFAEQDGPESYWAKRIPEVEAERDRAAELAAEFTAEPKEA